MRGERRSFPKSFVRESFNTKTPHSTATFMIDGRIAGIWTEKGGRLRLEPFGRLPREARSGLEEEAERLSDFLA
jgi:hypothetical protein